MGLDIKISCSHPGIMYVWQSQTILKNCHVYNNSILLCINVARLILLLTTWYKMICIWIISFRHVGDDRLMQTVPEQFHWNLVEAIATRLYSGGWPTQVTVQVGYTVYGLSAEQIFWFPHFPGKLHACII